MRVEAENERLKRELATVFAERDELLARQRELYSYIERLGGEVPCNQGES
jgi:hypothetical protein